MLTQLSTIKTRLALTVTDYDDLLTAAIKAVSARFDRECNRRLPRTIGFTEELSSDQSETPVSCYPIESVTKFEIKSNETDGWAEQTGVQYLIRSACIISLLSPLAPLHLPSGGTYEAFTQSDLLLEVRAVLKKYQRFLL